MTSGAPTPGGIHMLVPGGRHEPSPGGISFVGAGAYRRYTGHKSVDPTDALSSSGARVLQTRGVTHVRTEAKTTSVTFAWTLPTVPGGSTTAVASITTPTAASSTFLPDAAGTYVFRCVTTFVGSDAPNTITTDFTYVSA